MADISPGDDPPAESTGKKRTEQRNLPVWGALAGAVLTAVITGFVTYNVGYRSAEVQLENQRSQAAEARAKEQRDRRAEIYPRFLDAAQKVSAVAQDVYKRCPQDTTPGGCSGDRTSMDTALREVARARGDVRVWGSLQANEKAEAVNGALPKADSAYCVRIEPAAQQFRASSYCVSAIFLYQLPSGGLVDKDGKPWPFPIKASPKLAEFDEAVKNFQLVIRCDFSTQVETPC